MPRKPRPAHPAWLPRSVVIGGHRIRVVCAREEGHYGRYFPDDYKIEVYELGLRNRKAAYETLRHEMIEASLFIGGVAWARRYEQEPVVRCIECLFFPAWDKVGPRIKGRS